MELKDYQQQALDTFDAYLDELAEQRQRAEAIAKLAAEQPGLGLPVPDFAAEAWKALEARGKLPRVREGKGYSPRRDGTGQTVPNACLKIPTGGGKTLLAAAAVTRILGRYLSRNTGFVLWIVPNEAIYSQTWKQLRDREHPYRQLLDRAAAGRLKLLEKDDRLDARDAETHLCVLLLMLQSANRETKETLRIFRDRGNVHGFFPSADDYDAHFALLQQIPNLTAYGDQDRRNVGSIVQDSLGNVLRLLRPVVVMDEGHKAYSARAVETLYGFNPCFVLELSATPKDRPPLHANWLVDVRGAELAREEMIKLPINVKVKGGDDWRDCLREALELLNRLQAEAETLQANTARYLRPILLVQVERTGKEQREAGFIHAEDARELLLAAGLAEREIAVKTSEVNDLKAPENQDLLSPANPVRAIVTKQALQEGWDCPFAYVLCSLAASSNVGAMTQLVGRILRQPQAARTGAAGLDECYVVCHHAHTGDIVAAIKKGLEQDGMAELAAEIREVGDGERGRDKKPRTLRRRAGFEDLEIFLPVVNWVEGGMVRPLDCEQDVLLPLDWSALSVADLAARLPKDAHVARSHVTRITVTDGVGGEFFPAEEATPLPELAAFDPVYATRMIADLVPNPFVGRALVGELLDGLRARGFDDAALGAQSSFLLEELRRFLQAERDRLAEAGFVANVAAGRIQFRLRTDRHNWKMPAEVPTDCSENARKLSRPDGNVPERSLFSPVYEAELNGEEAEFACYLDEQQALRWWHRNVAKAGQYHVQGWRKPKVYPDFVFALTHRDGGERLVVLETKGDQLEGNLDTEYKRTLLRLMSESYRFENVVRAGELELVLDPRTSVACDLVLMSEWKTRVPGEYFPA